MNDAGSLYEKVPESLTPFFLFSNNSLLEFTLNSKTLYEVKDERDLKNALLIAKIQIFNLYIGITIILTFCIRPNAIPFTEFVYQDIIPFVLLAIAYILREKLVELLPFSLSDRKRIISEETFLKIKNSNENINLKRLKIQSILAIVGIILLVPLCFIVGIMSYPWILFFVFGTYLQVLRLGQYFKLGKVREAESLSNK